MTTLPRELQPDAALEERVLSAVVQAGLVRRRRRIAPAWLAAAAVIVLALGVAVFSLSRERTPGRTYVVLLYEDSTYILPPHGRDDERVAILARWADSLDAHGKFERAGRLLGPGAVDGLFIVRADDDADAARIAASCPFHRWGGRVEIRRFE